MQGRIILITLGILIFLSVLFNELLINLSIIKFFFGIIFLSYGFTFFKKRDTGSLGSLFFGVILLIDSFSLFPTVLNFWQIFLLLIASYILAAGLSGIFRVRRPHKKINKEISISDYPKEFSGDSLNLSVDVDWSYITIEPSRNLSIQSGSPLRIKASIDSEIYSFKKEYLDNEVKIFNKLMVSNVKVPRRSKISVYLNENISYGFLAKLNVSDGYLNFRNIKTNNVRVETTASKITIIPSEIDNSNIDIDSDVSSINVKLPNNTALIMNQLGELNFKNLEWMNQREDGSYISANFSEASYTCYLNISSEMSKLNIEFID
jgi:hypothetical protein